MRSKSGLLLLGNQFFKNLISAYFMFVNILLVLFLKYLIVSGFCSYNQRLNHKMHSYVHMFLIIYFRKIPNMHNERAFFSSLKYGSHTVEFTPLRCTIQ